MDKEGGPMEGNITDCLIVGEVKRRRSSVAEHVSLMGPSSLAHDISDPNNRIFGGCCCAGPRIPMSCLSWNCRGLGYPRAIPFLSDLVRDCKPDFIFFA